MTNLLSNAKRLLTLEELHCIIFFNTRSRKKIQAGGDIYMSGIGQAEKVVSKGSIMDNRLLSDFHHGDKEAGELMITKHEYIVHKKANTYFLVGSDYDDVVQEGFIGLYKAICDYDENKRASFRSFAELCVTRQIISSIKSATRLKHTPLNSYVSIYKPANTEDSERTIIDTIVNQATVDPSEWVEQREYLDYIQNELMKALTKLEWSVFCFYVQGWSYAEISLQIGRHEKSIDNALQRIKKKVTEIFEVPESIQTLA